MTLSDAQSIAIEATLRDVADELASARTPSASTSTPAPTGPDRVVTGDKWKLEWSDEFDRTDLGPRWRLGPRWAANGYCHGFDTTELGWYNPTQTAIVDNRLELTAKKETLNLASSFDKNEKKRSWSYQTGCATTAPDDFGVTMPPGTPWPRPALPATFAFTFGYFEASVWLPKGRGLWPAFWALPVDASLKPLEIDALEVLGHEPSAGYLTFHGRDGSNNSIKSNAVDWSTGFHTIGCNWQPDRIEWFIDGKTARTPITARSQIPAVPMYLILNLAVGGGWPGSPDASTVFPAKMVVDWVRVWQKA